MREKEEEIILAEIKEENERRIIIISIYNTKDWKNMKKRIDNLLEEREYDQIIIGGGFIRTRELGGSGI